MIYIIIFSPLYHRQLLIDCGIGATNNPNNTSESSSSSSSSSLDISTAIVSQHRVILFCQMKVMLDVIERDLFRCILALFIYIVKCFKLPKASDQFCLMKLHVCFCENFLNQPYLQRSHA